MKWSWRMGSVAGIALYVHATFLLLLAWVALDAYRTSRSAVDSLNGVLFVLAVFGTVVLHELGHALAVRRATTSRRRTSRCCRSAASRASSTCRRNRDRSWSSRSPARR